MTDLLTKPVSAEGDDHAGAAVDDTDSVPAEASPVEVVWLAPERKRSLHLGLWLGIPGGIIAAVAALCAVTLIAPGVLVAGVNVGWNTPGVASEVVAAALADTVVTLQTPSRDISLTGEELGLSVDKAALAELTYGEYPLWKVGAWNPGDVPITVDIDQATAAASLSAAAPTIFPVPVDAQVRYESKFDKFTATPAQAGAGIDFDELAATVSSALSTGSRTVTFDATPVATQPAVSTSAARTEASNLTSLVNSAGFYVDGTRVVTIDPAQAASWLSVATVDGELTVDVNRDAALTDLWKIVASLPRLVNQPATNEIIVTNSAGDHLRTVTEGVDGLKLGATSGIAAGYVDAFATGDSSYDLEVQPVAFGTTLSFRRIEVDKTAGQAILYENEKMVAVFPVAVGRPETPTPEGHFTIFWQLPMQDMGCVPGYDYCTKDVPWISYFAGDNGFHGTYWHDNFGAGAMMSHGCVNMRIADAETVYYWAQEGTEVWVHS